MLGICCHWLREEVKPKSGQKFLVNEMEEKSLQLGRYRSGKYTPDYIRKTYIHNIDSLVRMLPKIRSSGVRLFRMSSALLPLADQVDRSLWDNEQLISSLKKAGDFIKSHDMRLTTHPGQFCVLSSDSETVVDNAFRELSIHAWMMDSMGLDVSPKWAINIHGGKMNKTEALLRRIDKLPDNVRGRLTLENDESCYNIVDLLEVYQRSGVPVCFDTHHHVFNDGGLSTEEAHEASAETWPTGVKPLQHISNTEPSLINGSFSDRRKHSDMIHYVTSPQLNGLLKDEIDVEVECKMKNIGVFKMARDFNIPF